MSDYNGAHPEKRQARNADVNATPKRPSYPMFESVPALVRKSLEDLSAEELLFAIPAYVKNVDDYESLQCIDVEAVINDEWPDEYVSKSVTLKKIFVKLPSSGGFSVKFPIHVGDLVTLHYSHRNLRKFLDTDGSERVDELVEVFGDQRNCWAEVGFGTRYNHQNPSKDNLIIEGENTTITITPAGEVSVITSGTSRLESSGHTIKAPTTTIEGKLVVTDTSELNGAVTAGATVEATGAVSSAASVDAPLMAAASSLTVAGKEMGGHTHSAGTYTVGVDPVTGTSGAPV